MSLSDYSDLEQEIANAEEPKVLDKGTEVKVRIIQVKTGTSDKNNGIRYYQPVYDVPDDPMVKEFNDFLWDIPDAKKKGLDPKKYARSLNQFKNFAACFGLDYSRPFDWERDIVGLQGWIIVGVQHDDQYGDKNSVSKYVKGGQSIGESISNDEIPF